MYSVVLEELYNPYDVISIISLPNRITKGGMELEIYRHLLLRGGITKDTAELHHGKCRIQCFESVIHTK